MISIIPSELFANAKTETHGVKFHHIRGYGPRGGLTIAYYQPVPGKIYYAEAHCHPKDNYNKKLGRMKAEGRLNSPRFVQQYLITQE